LFVTFTAMFDDFEDDDINPLLERFREGVRRNESVYFDVEDFEALIQFFLVRNNAENAWKAWNWAADFHAENAWIPLLKARILMFEGHLAEALTCLEREPEDEEMLEVLWHLRAEIYSDLLEHDLALLYYRKVVKVCPDDAKAMIWMDMAHEYVMNDEQDEAIMALKRAIRLQPEAEQAYSSLFHLTDELGLAQDSLSFFSGLTDSNPYNWMAWFYLGLSYKTLDLIEEALRCFDLVITIKESTPEAHMEMASCFMHLESWASAKRSIEQARRFGGEAVGLDFMTGECLENQEDWQGALLYYRKVAEAVPGYAEAWMGIGVCLCESGFVAEGIAHMDHAIELESEYSEYRLIRAVWLRDSGALGEAETEYQSLSEMDASNWEVYYDWAALYVRMDDLVMALETMMQALKCEPNSALIHYRIAAVAYRQGSRQLGQDFLQKALQMDYSAFPEMLDLIPELATDSDIAQLIDNYKTHEN